MSRHKAFSLVEVITVLAIVLILALIALPPLIKSKTASELSLARVRLTAMRAAMEHHVADWGEVIADFNDPGPVMNLYRSRKTQLGRIVCSNSPVLTSSTGGLTYLVDRKLFYAKNMYCPLTSPIRYISDNETIDPFSDGTIPFGYDSRHQSVTPPYLDIEYGVFASAGPDRIAGHWLRIYPDQGLPYSPTNGSESLGELWGVVSRCKAGESETECLADKEFPMRWNFGPPAPVPDLDEDGIPNDVESGAPNNGDADHNGQSDTLQSNVSSFPDGGQGDYITVVSPPGTMLSQIHAATAESVGEPPSGAEFPLGLIQFQVEGVSVSGLCDVALLPSKRFDWDSYYKFGPTPQDPTEQWYSFIFDGTSGAEFDGSKITLRFQDGMRGDDDLVKNLSIRDLGGPVGQGVTSVSHWSLYE